MFELDLELSEGKLQLIPEADRRAVDPPIEVQAASWSAGGELDWGVKERQQVTCPNAGSRRTSRVDQSY
jgi:hypothetical protein